MRLLLLRGAFAALACIAAFGLLAAPGPFTPPTASAPLRPLPATDVNPLGATFFLDREVEPWKREQTVKMAKDAGIGWAKIMIAWQDVEPRQGRFYDDRYKKSSWEKFDEIVTLLEKYDIRPIARLDKPPDWALATEGPLPIRELKDYTAYVTAVAERYKGRIQHYQIWNEPNLAAEWGNLSPNPVNYTQVLSAASKAIRAADPNAMVLSAPLAQTLERSPRALPDTVYLQGMYDAGAGASFDILFANAYGFDKPPADEPKENALNFQRVKLLRDIMVANGDSNKAVWLNEVAWNAAPASFPKASLYWERVTEEQQASYTAEAIELGHSWDWLGVITLWYFRQVGDISPVDRADYYFRMVDLDFTPRLVYHAVQKLAGPLKTARPGVHQETSAAVNYNGSWLQRRSNTDGGGFAESSTAGDSIKFDFTGDALYLEALVRPDGGSLHVKIDGYESTGLPTDANGHSVVSLRADSASRHTIRLASGLTPGHHIAELRVVGDGAVAIDGLTVSESAVNLTPFFVQVGLVIVGAAGLIASFVFRRRG